MPKKLKSSIQHYICKIKAPPPPRSFSSMISGCKHPRTSSFSVNGGLHKSDHHEHKPSKDSAATLSDIDRFLVENFKSLYIENGDEDHLPHKNKEGKQEAILFGSPRFIDPPPHLCGSRRFFVPTGLSSSLIEEARLSMTSTSDEGGGSSSTSTAKTTTVTVTSRSCDDEEDDDNDDLENVNNEYIAVKTYSRSPYHDFRRSMQEMAEAKLEQDGNVDWDFMEELLVCYLNLNEKKSRKYIISAFVDVTVSLRGRRQTDVVPARQRRSSTKERRRKSRNVT